MTWQTIYNSFKENPRDVKTNPQRNNAPRWFYVYAQVTIFLSIRQESATIRQKSLNAAR